MNDSIIREMPSSQNHFGAFSIVPTPMGTAVIGPDSDLSLSIHAHFNSLTYMAHDGVRIWLENGDVHEFKGPVCVRGTRDYKVTVNAVEGAACGAFLATQIFAITPLNGSATIMKMVLSSALKNRTMQ